MHIEHNQLQQPIRLLQLTDSHLGEQLGETLVGMDTDASLEHVLALLKQQPSADLLLATGDISNGGSLASYQRFQQLTAGIARHALWLPGNHDLWSVMQQALPEGAEELDRHAEIGNWQIIMLDSTTPGEVGGSFSAQELSYLRERLEASVDSHVLICLHHHPIVIGCDWLDEQQVSNADEFFALLDEFEQVRGLLWGHIHQTIERERHGVKLMASPSTCIQFAPDSANFKLDRVNPGYRWLELHADGTINSGVSRVTAVNFDIDYEQANGY